jgi:hypothetical protein
MKEFLSNKVRDGPATSVSRLDNIPNLIHNDSPSLQGLRGVKTLPATGIAEIGTGIGVVPVLAGSRQWGFLLNSRNKASQRQRLRTNKANKVGAIP